MVRESQYNIMIIIIYFCIKVIHRTMIWNGGFLGLNCDAILILCWVILWQWLVIRTKVKMLLFIRLSWYTWWTKLWLLSQLYLHQRCVFNHNVSFSFIQLHDFADVNYQNHWLLEKNYTNTVYWNMKIIYLF